MNYSSFVYQFYDSQPELCKIAVERRDKLGFNKFPIYGGDKFRAIARLVGYNHALWLRSMIRKVNTYLIGV